MLWLLLRKDIVYFLKQPVRLAWKIVTLAFIILNIYIFNHFKENIVDSEIIVVISYCLPMALILYNDFILKYNFNILVLPKILPISNWRNANLSLSLDFCRFTYFAALIIAIQSNLLFGSFESFIISILFILNCTLFKFFVHYIIRIFNYRSSMFLICSSIIILIGLIIKEHLVLFVFLTLGHYFFYTLSFKYFRDDFYNTHLLTFNKSISKYRHYFLGYLGFKNLIIFYVLIKIIFVFLCIYNQHTNNYLLTPLMFNIIISPVFLFSYINNNVVVFNYKSLKVMSLARSNLSLIAYLSKIIFIGLIVDAFLTLPIFIYFDSKTSVDYILMVIAFFCLSIFTSIHFPKFKSRNGLVPSPNTSHIGTVLDFLFIGILTITNDRLIHLVILLVIIVLLIYSCLNFPIKFRNISENLTVIKN